MYPHAAVRPAGPFQSRPCRPRAVGLAIDGVVAPFAEIKRELLAVVRMLEVAAEVAHLRMRGLIDTDKHHLSRDPLPSHLKIEHCGHSHGWRHARDHISSGSLDFCHVPLRVLKAVERMTLEDNVRENAVDACLHFVRKASHHCVDDDHRCHAERDAHNACQRNPTGAKISPAEEQLVHRRASAIGVRALDRKENDIADRRGCGEKHDESIDSNAESASRRHTVPQRTEEIAVHASH